MLLLFQQINIVFTGSAVPKTAGRSAYEMGKERQLRT